MVIASDGRESYVMFMYPENGIQWTQSQGKDAPDAMDVPAQAGFDAGDGRQTYRLPGSGNMQSKNWKGSVTVAL